MCAARRSAPSHEGAKDALRAYGGAKTCSALMVGSKEPAPVFMGAIEHHDESPRGHHPQRDRETASARAHRKEA